MSFSLSKEREQQLRETVKRYPNARAAVLPALWLVKEEKGYVSDEAVEYVAKALDLPVSDVFGTLTFYTIFNRREVGKSHIQICRNICCWLRGSEDIFKYISAKLGISAGETTEDKKFTLSTVECLGACGGAPVIQINDDYYEEMTTDKVDEILGSLRGL